MKTMLGVSACLAVLAAACVTGDAPQPSPLESAQLGVACVGNDECGGDLVCAGARCRMPCATDEECGADTRCESESDTEPAACTLADSASTLSDGGEPDAAPSMPTPVPEADAGSPQPTDAGEGPDADAGPVDPPLDAGRPVDAGGPTPDAGVPDASPRTDAAVPLLAMGATCTADAQCQSGHCPAQDGVCCDLPCDGLCTSCSSAKTAFADGICAPVEANTDPDAECTDEGAASCGSDGRGCNGSLAAPACLSYPAGTLCSEESCVDGVTAARSECNAQGSCTEVSPAYSCAPYTCDDAAPACLPDCVDDDDCQDGYSCTNEGSCIFSASTATVDWVVTWPPDYDGNEASAGTLAVDQNGTARLSFRCSGWLPGLCSSYSNSQAYVITVDDTGDADTGTARQSSDLYQTATATFARDGSYGLATGRSFSDRSSASASRVDPNGTSLWSRGDSANYPSSLRANWVVPMPDQTTYVRWQATVDPNHDPFDVGEGPVTTSSSLFRYNPAGMVLFSRPWPSSARLVGTSTGALVSATTGTTALDLGCAASDTDGLYVSGFEASADCSWTRGFGAVPDTTSMATDDLGASYLAATVTGTVTLDSGDIDPPFAGAEQVLVAKLDAAGDVLWARLFAGEGLDASAAISVAPDGSSVVSGSFNAAMDIDGIELDPAGGSSFLIKLGANGNVLGLHQYTGGGEVAIAPDGTLRIASTYSRLDLGEGWVYEGVDGAGSVSLRALAIAKLRL